MFRYQVVPWIHAVEGFENNVFDGNDNSQDYMECDVSAYLLNQSQSLRLSHLVF